MKFHIDLQSIASQAPGKDCSYRSYSYKFPTPSKPITIRETPSQAQEDRWKGICRMERTTVERRRNYLSLALPDFLEVMLLTHLNHQVILLRDMIIRLEDTRTTYQKVPNITKWI